MLMDIWWRHNSIAVILISFYCPTSRNRWDPPHRSDTPSVETCDSSRSKAPLQRANTCSHRTPPKEDMLLPISSRWCLIQIYPFQWLQRVPVQCRFKYGINRINTWLKRYLYIKYEEKPPVENEFHILQSDPEFSERGGCEDQSLRAAKPKKSQVWIAVHLPRAGAERLLHYLAAVQ